MSNSFFRAGNYEVTGFRTGLPVGGQISLASAAVTAATRYRLLPSGNIGAIIDSTTIDLGTYEDGTYGDASSGIAFPASPTAGDVFRFTADVASGLTWFDINGTTSLTAASQGDIARFGTTWRKQRPLRADIRNAIIDTNWEIKIINEGYVQSSIIDKVEGALCTLQAPLAHWKSLQSELVEFVLVPRLILPLQIQDYSGAGYMQVSVATVDKYQPAGSEIHNVTRLDPTEIVELPFSDIDKVHYAFETANAKVFSWGEHTVRRS